MSGAAARSWPGMSDDTPGATSSVATIGEPSSSASACSSATQDECTSPVSTTGVGDRESTSRNRWRAAG